MTATAFGHALQSLQDGLTTFREGRPLPCPLVESAIDVTPIGALALVNVTRRFRNDEADPIEAILTAPVGFDAVVTDLSVAADGRRLSAVAQAKDQARATYEDAIDRGRLAVLHEEALRGLHMLSVANLPPGAEVVVTLTLMAPLTRLSTGALLRLPMTVGALYGASPLAPADDLVTSAAIRHRGRVTLTAGCAVLVGRDVTLEAGAQVEVPLDAAIELRFAQVDPFPVTGVDADGRALHMRFLPAGEPDGRLDLAILVDRSGSTGEMVGEDLTVHGAMVEGLETAFRRLSGGDRLMLWQFDDQCQFLGTAPGTEATPLLRKLKGPNGGTELGKAVSKVLDHGARDVLVLTDGQTWAHEVDRLSASPGRISAVLVGPGSLDAAIGHLCALTGGQVFHAPGADVGAVLAPALDSLRRPAGPVEGAATGGHPTRLGATRGGWRIEVTWEGTAGDAKADAIGRFAAALALPLLPADAATDWATRHGLCTHATSLVLVDEAGAAMADLPHTRKIPLEAPIQAMTSAVFMQVAPAPVAMMSGRMAAPQDIPRRMSKAMPSGPIARKRVPPPDLAEAFDMFPPPVGRDPLAELADRLDWEEAGRAFLAGDLGLLTAEDRRHLAERCDRDRLRELAADLGRPIEIIGLALVAALHACDDRHAQRFARRVLGARSVEDLVADWPIYI